MEDQSSTLSYDYVFNHVFKKLSDTFDKYRNVIPSIEDLERDITSKESGDGDPFQTTLDVIETLQIHGERSQLIQEVFENVKQDFWHGLSPEQVERHPGKYYIDSVAG